jgi:hypothetical protein
MAMISVFMDAIHPGIKPTCHYYDRRSGAEFAVSAGVSAPRRWMDDARAMLRGDGPRRVLSLPG